MHTFVRAILNPAAHRADQCTPWICRSRVLWWATIVALITLSLGPEMLGLSARAMAATQCTRCFGPTAAWTNNPYYGNRGTFFADVTGDGRADAIVVNDESIPFGRVVVRRSDGSQFLPNEEWTQEPFYGTIGTFFADVTGDGRADAIAVNDWGITVRPSDGTKFLPPGPNWTSNPYYGNRGTFFADVTGDGRADAIVVNDESIPFGRVVVRRSDGSQFLPNEEWTSEPYYGTRGTFFAEVTWDRQADAIVVNDSGITVRESTGEVFAGNVDWTSDLYDGTHGTFFANVDCGGADAIAVKDSGIFVRLSSGSTFASPVAWTSDPFYGTRGTFFADVTGDHRADAIAVNNSGILVRPSLANYGCL